MSTELETIQRSYLASKARADELSNLYRATPFHHKKKIDLATQSYRAISTILYGSLSACQIDKLEEFVKETSKELPVTLFDLREWINVIEIASNHRFLQSKQIAIDIFSKPVNDLKTELKVISKDTVTQLNSINSTIEMFKKQLLPLLREDAKKNEDLKEAYEKLLKDKNIIMEEKKNVLRDTKNLNKKIIEEEIAAQEKFQLQSDMAKKMEIQQEKIIKKLKSEIEDKIALLASNKSSSETRFESMKEEYEIKLEKKNYQLQESNIKLDDLKEKLQKLNEKYDNSIKNNELKIKLLTEQNEMNMKQLDDDFKAIIKNKEEEMNQLNNDYIFRIGLKNEEILKLKEELSQSNDINSTLNKQNSDDQEQYSILSNKNSTLLSEKNELIANVESLESRYNLLTNDFKLTNENKDLSILKLNEEIFSLNNAILLLESNKMDLESNVLKLNKIENEKLEAINLSNSKYEEIIESLKLEITNSKIEFEKIIIDNEEKNKQNLEIVENKLYSIETDNLEKSDKITELVSSNQ